MEERPVHLTVAFPGAVVMPSWLVLCFVGSFLLAAFCLVAVWQTNRDTKLEIRSLQLHAQDIENTLIRANLAHRSDMAPWTASEQRNKGGK